MLKELFSTARLRADDEWDGALPWWNKRWEWHSSRVHFVAGDLLTMNEKEAGGRAGAHFGIELELAQEDIPAFYLPDRPKAVYDVHMLTVIFWRWGFHLAIRGRTR